MAHAQAQFTIHIDPDFLKRLNLFMANVQSFQIKAQQAFQYRQAQVKAPLPQSHLKNVLLNIKKMMRLLEKMAQTIESITDRLISTAMGYLGKAFMRGLMAAMPILGSIIPVVGTIIGVTVATVYFVY